MRMVTNQDVFEEGDKHVVGLLQIAELDLKTLEHVTMHLSKNKIERLIKVLSIVKEKKYSASRKNKILYGNLPRVLNKEQLNLFFERLRRHDNYGVYTAFCLQFFYALRIGELSGLSLVPGQKLVQVENKKCRRIEYLPLIEGTEHLFKDLEKIRRYNPNYLRKYFRETLESLGDDYMFVYALDEKGKKRHQFSTHCLRKTAGNLLRMHTGDPYKTSVYLRHNTKSVYGSTAYYMHYDMIDMRRDLNTCMKEYVDTFQKDKCSK